MSLVELKSDQEFKETLAKHSNYLVIVLFSAKFVEKECKQIKDAVGALVESTQPNSIIGFEVDADAVGQATVKELKIECIPSVLLFANSKEVARVTGTDVSELIMKIKEAIIKFYPLAANLDQTPGNLEARLKQLINSSPLFIFMKGTPSAPRCKFSKQLVSMLEGMPGCTYQSHDILSDQEAREGMKVLANWPTFPMIYWKGEFVGGLDIVSEMVATQEFQKMISEG